MNSLRSDQLQPYSDTYQYLFLDLSLSIVRSAGRCECECSAIASKVLLFALPLIMMFELPLDIISWPFTWAANQICLEPSLELQIKLDQTIELLPPRIKARDPNIPPNLENDLPGAQIPQVLEEIKGNPQYEEQKRDIQFEEEKASPLPFPIHPDPVIILPQMETPERGILAWSLGFLKGS